ncbi:MAG: alpha-L-fucosidase [Bacteroidales bacterium]|nr:alpha-L-fucosidase [Bacteroidales bacterium]
MSYQYYTAIPADATQEEIIEIAANLTPSPRQFNWQQMELTAFLHFGMNTFTGQEWGNGTENPQLFNPSELDAEQWVTTCKNAGFKLVILTAKHHDGFCLWPSAYTEHSIKNSPYKNGMGDVVREIADACAKYNMKLGVYLSPWDRNSPHYGTDAYNDYFVNQLTELLTNYGTISEVWFDGANGEGPNGKRQEYDWDQYAITVRQLQPEAVMAIAGKDVRWVGTETGYGSETEWSVVSIREDPRILGDSPEQITLGFKNSSVVSGTREALSKAQFIMWYPAETDVSIRPGWFYHSEEDNQVKTPDILFDIYCSSVGRNGGLLLNIPPDSRGLISDIDIDALTKFKEIREQTFTQNLLKNAAITCSNGINNPAFIDNNYNTFWTTSGTDNTTVIEFVSDREICFDLLELQENIKIGQRIESFRLEHFSGSSWVEITRGTTVGYKRILRFEPTTARQIRLVIESSRMNPALSEIGLYKQVKMNTTGIHTIKKQTDLASVFSLNNRSYIETNQAGDLQIYDLQGRLVDSKTITAGITELPSKNGIYFIRFNSGKQFKILKLN